MKTKVSILFIISFVLFHCNIMAQKGYADKVNQLNSKGQKEGLWIDTIQKIRLREVYYKNGIESGIFKQYNLEGRLLIFGEYCEGKECGTWYYFGSYGHLIMTFKDFSKNTYSTINEGNGEIYVPDYKCYMTSYYSNGNIKDEGLLLWNEGDSFESDFSIEYGEWKYYDETGTLIKTKEFK